MEVAREEVGKSTEVAVRREVVNPGEEQPMTVHPLHSCPLVVQQPDTAVVSRSTLAAETWQTEQVAAAAAAAAGP